MYVLVTAESLSLVTNNWPWTKVSTKGASELRSHSNKVIINHLNPLNHPLKEFGENYTHYFSCQKLDEKIKTTLICVLHEASQERVSLD